MSNPTLPTPTLTISKTDARRFMLAHHHLWPPRQLKGKAGILEFIRHVGSIQFDPINMVGRNPDLVLQSRVKNYRPAMLDELLYADRQVLDGFDKVASIYALADWPYFARHRTRRNDDPRRPPAASLAEVLQAVHDRGPLSSLDFKNDAKVDWHWGPTKMARAALESLYATGHVGVHHRVSNRRIFDLVERLLPAELLSAPDPNESEAAYQNWHVLRRVGGLGLAYPGSSEHWLGIVDVKSQARRAALRRLVEDGQVIAVSVEDIPNCIFFIRTEDLPTLEAVRNDTHPQWGAAIMGPLDNFMWDRGSLRRVFDFDYVWEVYKPKATRKYGYYVLPIIYGDKFAARFDPAFDKKKRVLTITNWWWEDGIQPDEAMQSALMACCADFVKYLGAKQVHLGGNVENEKTLQWIREVEIN